MGKVIEFPVEATQAYREIEEELSDFTDQHHLDQYVYNSIIQNLAHVNSSFSIDDQETLKLIALTGRIHRTIGNWQMGRSDPLLPYLLKLIEDLNLNNIKIDYD